MLHAELESMLQQAMGLDVTSIGSSAIERALTGRMLFCDLNNVSAYLERVRTSGEELQALIEAVIVPETWFFRDREAFVELARVMREEWLPENPEGTLRLLSVPCSTGEEPYSMAMTLLDAGLSPKRYRIDAVDISAQGINYARCAVYRRNSFRGTDFKFRERHFATTALGARLSDAAREAVHFQQANLLADDFLPGSGLYDIIFCRNLLIYFDREAQDRAVEVLERLLRPEGVLFIGPSESGLLLNHGFISGKVPLAFAFRRSGAKDSVNVTVPAKPKLRPASDAHKILPSTAANPDTRTRVSIAAEPPATRESTHAHASRLADEGRLAEAAKACEENLLKYGPSVSSFFLLGLIRAAAGNLAEAREYYRKALYLDRNHHDTLVHLGLLLEKQGDRAGARAIHERLKRVLKKRSEVP